MSAEETAPSSGGSSSPASNTSSPSSSSSSSSASASATTGSTSTTPTATETTAEYSLPYTVFVYDKAWGLPSLEPASTELLTYLKVCKQTCSIVPCDNPRISPSGQLPVLHVRNIFVQHNRCTGFLKENVKDIDFGLSAREKGDVEAYSSMVHSTLEHARLFNWWVDEDNFDALTAKEYARKYRFPLNQMLPSRMRSAVVEQLEAANVKASTVYADARQCYEALSARLGDEQYFFPEHGYSSLDVCVFSHLILHLHAPMPNHRLREDLLEFPQLTLFCGRMLRDLFGIDEPAFDPVLERINQEDEDRASTWTTMAYSAAAVAGMFFVFLRLASNHGQ
eukprot:TRINITY_DN2279_c1_g2_i1.p1 TRINITY_DN2279_c1_g2~~TRINITY_DN2279_c1_g2_i1.p1  ORF type:complete len:337 (+),score=100.28 TRINITY_DN2279_c1_g2_i1:36-1046(+)